MRRASCVCRTTSYCQHANYVVLYVVRLLCWGTLTAMTDAIYSVLYLRMDSRDTSTVCTLYLYLPSKAGLPKQSQANTDSGYSCTYCAVASLLMCSFVACAKVPFPISSGRDRVQPTQFMKANTYMQRDPCASHEKGLS